MGRMQFQECYCKPSNLYSHLQLYEIDDNPKRREFLDELFTFMQKRGKLLKILIFLVDNSPNVGTCPYCHMYTEHNAN